MKKRLIALLLVVFAVPSVVNAESKYLYDVLKTETEKEGGVAREYTREHQDTVDGSGKEKIYYYHASTDEDAIAIKNKNNVIFGNFCWEIYRTTDSGGVKILYNGRPSDGRCYGYGATIGESMYTIYDNIYYIGSAGYMYNELLNNWDFIRMDYNQLPYFGNSVTYQNGVYKLVDTIRNDGSKDLSNYHYFCADGSLSCDKAYYLLSNYSDTPLRGILLENGIDIKQHLNKSLYADDVNKTNSALKQTIDAWYMNNLTEYTKYLEDTVFCQNRNFAYENNLLNPDGGNKGMYFHKDYSYEEVGDVESDNYYFNTNLKCNNETDRFSTLNEKAKLKYPVATINLAEALLISNYFDSGSYGQNVRSFYGSRDYSSYWLLTPHGTGIQTYGWGVGYRGGMYYSYGSNKNDVRPMVSLKKGITYSNGDGSKDNPYVINYTHSVNVEFVNETKDITVEINDLNQVAYNEELSLKVLPIKGYKVNNIKIIDDDDNEVEYKTDDNINFTFTMPNSNVKIIPTYERVKNAVNVEDNINTKEIIIEVNDFEAVVYEDMVKFIIIPKNEYEIETIKITDENGNNVEYKKTGKDEYEFIMPDTNVVITPVYKNIRLVNVPDTFKEIDYGNLLLISFFLLTIFFGIVVFINKKITYDKK